MIVILNDNEMSIDRNVGGMSRYLQRLRMTSGYLSAKKNTESFLNKIPVLGKGIIAMIMAIKRFFRFITAACGGVLSSPFALFFVISPKVKCGESRAFIFIIIISIIQNTK
jgi:hypothetical protein